MNITAEDKEQFHLACKKLREEERCRLGIGTLSEKTVHAVLKNYLVPRPEFHEVKCEGYVADILFEDEIFEIQTANFNKLRNKLERFLKEYEVTIVYPIPATKWLYWINQETGECSQKRKSPKRGSYYQSFYELYKIKPFLSHPKLHIRLILVDVEEYRLLNGIRRNGKKDSVRYDRIPISLVGDLMMNSVEDYVALIPDQLPDVFTSKEYAKATKLNLRQAQCGLHVLHEVGVVVRVGKNGNAFLYQKAVLL